MSQVVGLVTKYSIDRWLGWLGSLVYLWGSHSQQQQRFWLEVSWYLGVRWLKADGVWLRAVARRVKSRWGLSSGVA